MQTIEEKFFFDLYSLLVALQNVTLKTKAVIYDLDEVNKTR